MFRFLGIMAVAFTIFAGSSLAQDYRVDAGASLLKWKGEKIGKQHYGTIDIKDGYLTKTGDNFSGEFRVDMTTMKNDDIKDAEYNAKLIGHLKSDDFFSVEKHNTTTFKIKSISSYKPKKDQYGNYWVKGDLTIKGITNEIGFPAELKFDSKGFTAKADIVIDRSKWDVRYGSGSFFDNLGDKMISDDIKFELSLVGNVRSL